MNLAHLRLKELLISKNRVQFLASLLLAGMVLFQVGGIWRDAAGQVNKIRRDLSQPAWWRGARLNQGRPFAQYILFLRQQIPENGHVVLPPRNTAERALTTTPVMQFFLAPRPVLNCTQADCALGLSNESTYFIGVPGFPPPEVRDRGQFVDFNQNWGVLSPAGASTRPIASSSPHSSPLRLGLNLAGAWIWLAVLTWAGALLIQRIASGLGPLIAWGLGFGVSSTALTLLLAAASLGGMRLGAGLVIALTLVGAVLVFRFSRQHQPGAGSVAAGRSVLSARLWQEGWLIPILFLGALSALISVFEGYRVGDELLLWGPKGIGIAVDGTIRSVTHWGTNTVPYPLHIPLLIAAADWLFQELLPASKLIFPLYHLGLMLLFYGVLIRMGVGRANAGLAALLVGSAGLIFRHGTLALANLPAAYFLVAATAILQMALEQSDSARMRGEFFTSGLLYVGAAWTRPESATAVWFLIAWLCLWALIRRRKTLDRFALAWLLAPVILYNFFWNWLGRQVYPTQAGRAELLQLTWQQNLVGNLHLAELAYVLKSMVTGLFSLQVWGWLGIAAVAGTVIGLLRYRQQPGQVALILSGLLYLGLMAGMYYAASYDPVHDIRWWVNTGLERMILPGVLLLWLGGAIGMQLPKNREYYENQQ